MDKDEIKNKADDIFKFVLDGLHDGKEFVYEQAPLLVREIVRWGIARNCAIVLICVIVVTVSTIVWRYCWKQADDEAWIVGLFCSFVVGSVGAIVAISSAFTALQAYMAPRLYLLTVLKDLIK